MSEGFRLSLQQRRLFFLGAGAARTVGRVEVPAGVAAAKVREALAEAVARHEILRTFFVSSPGIKVPLQVIADAADFEWSEEAGDPEAVFERERGRAG
ncbi:MAG TPA: hypothetical protein VHN15_07225, partial [Thermoanaerobaculia bacterium]|nr:hypothetical protein [Thermoanaerobaculia bacterium]